jgi:hypothetical protein
VPTRIVLLSVTDPVLVREGTVEVLDQLNRPDPMLVPFTRLNGTTVHISRAAVALVEDDPDLAADPALSTTTTLAAPQLGEEAVTFSPTT